MTSIPQLQFSQLLTRDAVVDQTALRQRDLEDKNFNLARIAKHIINHEPIDYKSLADDGL